MRFTSGIDKEMTNGMQFPHSYLNVIASNIVVVFRTSIYMLDTFLHVISPNYTSFMHSRFAYVENVGRCLFGFHTGRAIVTKKRELEREIWRNTDTTSQGTHADPNRIRAA
jgi:hypothetical protein